MLQNKDFPIGRASWTAALLQTLKRVAETARNFKVRINACIALSRISNATQLGSAQTSGGLLSELIADLERLQLNQNDLTEVEFAQVKYRDQYRHEVPIPLRR